MYNNYGPGQQPYPPMQPNQYMQSYPPMQPDQHMQPPPPMQPYPPMQPPPPMQPYPPMQHYPPMEYYPPGDRSDFIRVVMMILSLMLAFTASFVMMIMFIEPLNAFFWRYGFIMVMISGVGYMICSLTITCCPCGGKTSMANIACLCLVMIFLSMLAASITIRYKTNQVVMAVGLTAFLCIGLALLAAYSGIDFTKCYIFFFVIGIAALLLVIGETITYLVIGYVKALDIVVCFVLLVLLSISFVMQLQLVIGNGEERLEDDEYILGAMMLYASIIFIFLKILRILDLTDAV